MRLYWDPTGPWMEYKAGFLHIKDLNPEIETRWRMSRLEMLWTGFNFIMAAIVARRALEGK